jgi:hypothetical protein
MAVTVLTILALVLLALLIVALACSWAIGGSRGRTERDPVAPPGRRAGDDAALARAGGHGLEWIAVELDVSPCLLNR